MIGQKTIDPSFKDLINIYDILALTETWHKNETCIQNNILVEYLFLKCKEKPAEEK